MIATRTLAAINASVEAAQEVEHRSHLGASVIGERCQRKLWYGFRWAGKEMFEGRMLRLFERGQLEEERFTGYLRGIGAELWPVNPETGGQWRISFGDGYGGGASDGVGRGIPDLPPTPEFPKGPPFNCEFKTHNDKSFQSIKKEGLCVAHEKHFAQTQVYSFKLRLPYSLYCAVNKNTDELHLEIIQCNPVFAQGLVDKAERIIESEEAPPKINASPGFWQCNFCQFKQVCHFGEKPEVNCRTCEFSARCGGGEWLCTRYNYKLNKAEQHAACASYTLKKAFLT